MKIVIDARMYGLEHTGIGRYIGELISELIKIDKKNEYVLLLKEKYYKELSLPRNFKKILVDVQHYTVREQFLLPFILYKENPDIVHFPQLNVPILYFGKSIVTVHDLTQLDWNNKATTLAMPLYLIKHIALRIAFLKVKSSNAIICPSNQVRNELIEYDVSESKIKVIYEGFNQSKYHDVKNKYKLGDKYFIYVGNAYPHKNVEMAIDAVCEFNKNQKSKYKLAIVSARNLFTDKIRKYIEMKGQKDSVKLLGFVPDNDLFALLHKSTAFIFPSLREGFGLPGIEALAAGTLLIASDIPVFKEVYGDNAFYFDPMNKADLVDKLYKVSRLSDQNRSKIIGKAKQYVTKFSWEKMATSTLDLYNNC